MRDLPHDDLSDALGVPGHLVAVVMSHAEAPIADWSPLLLDEAAVRLLLERSRASRGIRGIAVLATCSRTDVFAEVEDPVIGVRMLRDLLQGIHDAPRTVVARTRVMVGGEVPAHLFRVTAGLASIALGEHEIQGQVRHALQLASELHLTSPLVHRLLERALATGGRVRHETMIGQGGATLGAAAASAVAEVVAPETRPLVVVVGAGHMAQQAARHFRGRCFQDLVIVNRGRASGEQLARAVGAEFRPWESLAATLAQAGAVVAAVRADHAVIDRAMLAGARGDAAHPLPLVDLGSPPNIAPECAAIPGVVRIDLDALHERARQAYAARAAEVREATAIVDDEVARFMAWCEHRRLSPTVRRLHEAFHDEAERVVAREARRLGIDGDEREQLQRFADALVRRLLHRPLTHLHDIARTASVASAPTTPAAPIPRLSVEHLVIEAFAGRYSARASDDGDAYQTAIPSCETCPASRDGRPARLTHLSSLAKLS